MISRLCRNLASNRRVESDPPPAGRSRALEAAGVEFIDDVGVKLIKDVK
jgi:hypothetical protein